MSVGSGIFLSRLFGLLRERAVAHYFGVGPLADVFASAFRAPNILQNLLGEGALSAAFIPIFSQRLEAGQREEASRLAGAVFGFLLAVVAVLTLLGVFFAPLIVTVFTPGYLRDAAAVAAGTTTVDRFPLAVSAVRLLFPMAGILVLSAWCLAILNSHRRFFLPYVSPVLWNASIITALVWAGSHVVGTDPGRGRRLLLAACVGALIGGLLQFAVQLPAVWRLIGGIRPSLSMNVPGVRDTLRRFVPALAGRGVVQISNYVDQVLGSLLAVGAVGALRWAQILYALPISLFGIAIAAAELPELSRLVGRGASGDDGPARRLERALRQMAFFTVPTCVGFLLFGFLLVGAVYRTGEFTVSANWLVYLVLCGYSIGLLATTSSRLLQNGFFAVGDTRTPAKIAALRVSLSAGAGIGLMWWLDQVPLTAVVPTAAGAPGLYLGAVGLGLAAGLASWIELLVLRRMLTKRLQDLRWPWSAISRMTVAAVLAAAASLAVWWAVAALHPLSAAIAVFASYGVGYLLIALALGIGGARDLIDRMARMFRRGS